LHYNGQNFAAKEDFHMRSILLLVLGVPIPIIILVGLLSHF